MQGAGFRVQGSGFRVQGAGFRVQGAGGRRVRGDLHGGIARLHGVARRRQRELEYLVRCLGFRGLGFEIWDMVLDSVLGSRVQDRIQSSGFRVQGSECGV